MHAPPQIELVPVTGILLRYAAGEPLAARTRSRARSSLVEAMRRDRGDKRRW